MSERYNVYFAGQVMDGHDPQKVRDALGTVFNASQTTLDKLFSGKLQLLKRDCDQATAQQFKEAMARAGAVAIIKVAENASAKPGPSSPRMMTAAEKIAALAAAPVPDLYGTAAADTATKAIPPDAATDTAPEPGTITLTAPGTAVLRDNERAAPVTREIDTSALAVDTTAQRLSPEPPPPPVAPDTSHLSLGEVGATIPSLPRSGPPLAPAIDGLALSAPGTDFSDCAAPDVPAVPLDLSALAVLPSGAALLEEQYRKRESAVAPATDHIALQD